ncbi:MAG TPA: SRPBCC family protein [Polyangiaceae bacterium]|nr:SRPBCC family protein [Polyangiaceae bacterium]
MSTFSSYLGSAALGAAAVYWLDPAAGARRRGLARDKLIHSAQGVVGLASAASRDALNRARGLVAEALGALHGGPVDDEVLRERVRARLGHVLSHPGAIEVRCEEGKVELVGRILEDELAAALEVTRGVRGVREVVNTLVACKTAEGVPELQGGHPRPRPESWPPSARLGAVVAGAGLVAVGRRAGLIGTPLGVAGLALLTRGALDLPLRRVTGVGAGRRAVDVEKAIEIDAPVGEVFALWHDMEGFPRFMSHVKEVRCVGSGRYHWTVEGPAGVPFGWDAIVTAWEPNERICWKSVAGAAVRQSGMVRFEHLPSGCTRLSVKLSYNPPAGAIGHALAAAFGLDPKKQMAGDLVRLKSLVETGKVTGRWGEVRRDEIKQRSGDGARAR